MLTKQIVRQSNIIKTLNQSAIVATMADCFFMGYTHIYIYVHRGRIIRRPQSHPCYGITQTR